MDCSRSVSPGMPVTPTSTTVTGGGLTDPVAAQITAIVTQLATLTQQLSGIVAAQQGAALTTAGAPMPTSTAPALPTSATPPTAATPSTSTDPLRGFTITADATEQQQFATAITKLEMTSIGRGLMSSIRDQGIQLDIVSDADYQAVTGSLSSAAVFVGDTAAPSKVLVRESVLASEGAESMTHILAHEFAHASQWVAGDRDGSYAPAIGTAAAAGLTTDQIATGDKLLREAGAELVASAIDAQLTDPARFAEAAAKNFDAALATNWTAVNEGGYNPKGYTLPQVVAGSSVQLVRTNLSG